MKEKININTKLTKALREGVEHSHTLVETIRKNHNEFVWYWLCSYDAATFDPMDMFEPNLYDVSLDFNPGDLYGKYYDRTGHDSKKYYESDGKFNMPKKFSDGPMLLNLGHYETDSRNALFIPTTCLTSCNSVFYRTLKKYTPKDCFPADYYTDSYKLSNRMRPEVTHAVILYTSNQDGDCDISVRWLQDSLLSTYKEFIGISEIFEHLWEGFQIDPFNNLY
tara:strand:- start:504 stop:1169 length:666 start_codon:yes stop_codon:yes gene_type:complete